MEAEIRQTQRRPVATWTLSKAATAAEKCSCKMQPCKRLLERRELNASGQSSNELAAVKPTIFWRSTGSWRCVHCGSRLSEQLKTIQLQRQLKNKSKQWRKRKREQIWEEEALSASEGEKSKIMKEQTKWAKRTSAIMKANAFSVRWDEM